MNNRRNDKNRRTQEDFLEKYLPLTLLQGFEKVVWGFTVRGSWRPNITEIFWPHYYGRQRCVFLVLLMLGSTLLCAGFLYCIFSGPQLIRAPSPFGLVGLSLPHLVHLRLQLSATQLAPELELNWFLSWLSYIFVRRPLDLWNRMFNRHQAEITVMQFRGHSLPARQSMRVSWDFLACPILLANFRPREFLSKLPLECVTSFRCIILNGILLGPKVKI